MKIAFTGSHGVGKTTLISTLEKKIEKIKKVEVTKEIPRIICDLINEPEYFRRNQNNLKKQMLIFFGQIIQEYELSKKDSEILICDRTIFDHWAYTIYLMESELDNELKKVIEYFMVSHMLSYNHIFYIPIEFEVEDDGTREDDRNFQKEVDRLIIKNLNENKIPYTEINGSIEERLKTVSKKLNL